MKIEIPDSIPVRLVRQWADQAGLDLRATPQGGLRMTQRQAPLRPRTRLQPANPPGQQPAWD